MRTSPEVGSAHEVSDCQGTWGRGSVGIATVGTSGERPIIHRRTCVQPAIWRNPCNLYEMHYERRRRRGLRAFSA